MKSYMIWKCFASSVDHRGNRTRKRRISTYGLELATPLSAMHGGDANIGNLASCFTHLMGNLCKKMANGGGMGV
jgi:hypothetical protein